MLHILVIVIRVNIIAGCLIKKSEKAKLNS